MKESKNQMTMVGTMTLTANGQELRIDAKQKMAQSIRHQREEPAQGLMPSQKGEVGQRISAAGPLLFLVSDETRTT